MAATTAASEIASDLPIPTSLQATQSFATPRNVTMNVDDQCNQAETLAEGEMWNDFVPGEDIFEAGPDPVAIHLQKRQEFERRVHEYGLWGGLEHSSEEDIRDLEHAWDEAEQDDLLSDMLKDMDLERSESEVEYRPSDEDSKEWFPYPSKLFFLLDAIDNLPRLRISNSMMKAILWLLQEVGVKQVPAFGALQKVQNNLRKEAGVPTIHWKSPKGNTFSFNDPRTIVANDWANPMVCPHIKHYPVITLNGVISEIYHAQKWRQDLDRHVLSPMYDDGKGCHYFIDEPADLEDGRLVVPVRWLSDEKGGIWADVWEITKDETTEVSTIRDEHVILIEATNLRKNILDLEDDGLMPQWSRETIEKGHPSRMPNPDRALADGVPIYTSMIDIFGDDVSGNRSKSWNKHWNIYMAHRNLPRKHLNQQFHTHFVSTSTHASVPEQFQGIKAIIESTHQKPIQVRNACSGCETKIKIYCNCAPGDNPSQSETCGHIGGNGNFPCRKCHVGGTQKEKETDEGFHRMFSAGSPRSAEETLKAVETQVSTACLGVAQAVADLQTETGIKDAYTQHWIEQLVERARAMRKAQPQRSASDIQEELMIWVIENKEAVFNPFLLLKGFDVSRDTPVELLHTILLGIVKYVWHGSHTSWSSTQKELYSTRLQATNVSGLTVPAIRGKYIMQYANSLIGRQLKTLVQVNVFHVHDIIDHVRFNLTKALGEMSALLWFTEIRVRDEYLLDVVTAVGNVLDLAALVDPSKIIAKIKYHLLPHIAEDIIRFGPLVGVATEVFECFNAVFRYCSILSNHQAPSRDIAYQLSEQETVKHLLSGGWWAQENGDWTRPGPSIRTFLSTNPVLKALVGWPQTETLSAGTLRLQAIKRDEKKRKMPRAAFLWSQTLAASAINNTEVIRDPAMVWYKGKWVVSISEDHCNVGDWVFAKSPYAITAPPVTGKIIEILQDTTGKCSFIVLDTFQVAMTRHELFGMPFLVRQMNEPTSVVMPTANLLFHYNVQHDCRFAGCDASGRRFQVQERTESAITETYINHKPVDQFVINTHAFHNAHLLREILPRHLTAPIPFSDDREKHHTEIACKLRNVQDAKRAATKEATALKAAQKQRASTVPDPHPVAGRKRKRVPDNLNDPELESAV